MYSALKRDGKPLYEYARAGIEIERKARRVVIYDHHRGDPATALVNNGFVFEVRCSKGTYVRTLAADIGERLGCGAHLTALRRTAIGDLSLEKAHTLEDMERLEEMPATNCCWRRIFCWPALARSDSMRCRLRSSSTGRLWTARSARPARARLRAGRSFHRPLPAHRDDRLRPLRLVPTLMSGKYRRPRGGESPP
jgi:tRNA U55 pseudouridine synthase TruB